MHRYLIFSDDGSSSGEANYAVPIEPGELIVAGDGRRHRVIKVVPVEENDSAFAGFLMVQPA